MELYLKREYHPQGTNGKLTYQNKEVCQTIELPWKNNKRSISCIPAGRYRLVKREHPKHGSQLLLANVPNREGILIHPANFALRELQGCIAPVTKCTGEGQGNYSKVAFGRLEDLVQPVLEAEEAVWLVIR
jgi:hypothetical protein